jgi:hypothetical protein
VTDLKEDIMNVLKKNAEALRDVLPDLLAKHGITSEVKEDFNAFFSKLNISGLIVAKLVPHFKSVQTLDVQLTY